MLTSNESTIHMLISFYIHCGFYSPVENLVKSLDPSVCTHVNNAKTLERVFVKFSLGNSYEKLPSHLNFSIEFDYFKDCL